METGVHTPPVSDDEYSRPGTSQSTTIKQPPSPPKVLSVCVSIGFYHNYDGYVIVQLRRVSSLPELWGAFLLCDLGLTSRPDSEYLYDIVK